MNKTLLRYFEENLARISNSDKSRALLFYCQSDCWMAWNALKRAAESPYSQLYRYPERTDGWTEWDTPDEPATPVTVDIRPPSRESPRAPTHYCLLELRAMRPSMPKTVLLGL